MASCFHDLGLTGWLGLIPFGGGVLVGLTTSLVPLPPEVATPLVTFGPLAFTVPVIICLGFIPGQGKMNRFGPPSGQESPAEVF